MTLQFKPSAKATRRAKVLLIGEAGTGKTHAALTFPKPAVIDAEGSIDWFADRFSFISLNTKSFKDVRDIVADVRAGNVECETLVIDSGTTIFNSLMGSVAGDKEDLAPRDWGRIKRRWSGWLDEIYHKTNKHIVLIGWIKPTYAKEGTIVDGKRVQSNQLISIGEQFDGDKKTEHAFDFIFKIEGNDGKRTRATVIKSRSGKLVRGQTIEDFSFKTLEPLLPNGDHEATGMSDEEQAARDVGIDKDPPPVPPPSAQELKDLWTAKGGQGDFREFVANVLGSKQTTLSAPEKGKVLAAIEALPGGPTPISSLPSGPPVAAAADAEPPMPASEDGPPSDAQRGLYFALCKELGYDDVRRHNVTELVTGKKSSKKISGKDMNRVIDLLNKRLDGQNQAAQP